MKTLLSVPPALSNGPLPGGADFITQDPPGLRLGSGGGTAHVLAQAWRHQSHGPSFDTWLASERKIILHAGGQSRRLPAYAACGKALVPIPVFRWSTGQRLDQTLLDLQKPILERLLERAPEGMNTLVASGDVLVWNDTALPPLPQVDVLCVGLWDSAETASHHGVFFTPRAHPEHFAFMRQKPSPSEILSLAADHLFLLDVGIWIFSDRAVSVLLRKCGWSGSDFPGSLPGAFDLYTRFGEALGHSPTHPDPEISSLSCAVLPLNQGEFYHFGTNKDLVASSLALQNRVHDPRRIRSTLMKPHPSLFVQNADTGKPLDPDSRDIWIENADLGPGWTLRERHILTGIPANNWQLDLPAGLCIDMAPLGQNQRAVRLYGFDDAFRGPANHPDTLWMGRPASQWFTDRGLPPPGGQDLQDTPLFPVFSDPDLDEKWLQWLIHPSKNPDLAARFQKLPLVSATDLANDANLQRQFAEREKRFQNSIPVLARHAHRSVFYQVDLQHSCARMDDATLAQLPDTSPDPRQNLFAHLHERMFRALLKRRAGGDGTAEEQQAFDALRESIIAPYRAQSLSPRNTALSDQVIWARSPVRLDLAGGWTDTPPYCFLHGGRVVNLSVELNGQPPIQVFARASETPAITLRSIDLGITEVLESYTDIQRYNELGSGFSIPRAALALCGFDPSFQSGVNHRNLREQLQDFGGGIELSLLCAVPKGSGLGTSSILAATVLAALSELCGFHWDLTEIGNRTLALEQMLTSGGGWQDQFGGITRGLKQLSTRPGINQNPEIRWLPDYLFTDTQYQNRILLYYTGITRVAKNILGDIVRGMFLNRQRALGILAELTLHSDAMVETLQRGDFDELGAQIRRTWELNQLLDPGTNPPEVQSILQPVQQYLSGMKLLGAGGGGYLLMLAKDGPSAGSIRQILEQNAPNERARFVEVSLSRSGLQVTRS